MKTIGFYSFKGGSGRTTALGNVAAALAQKGRNVLCIDLDIDGPGLQILFNEKKRPKTFLQDYMCSPMQTNVSPLLLDLRHRKNFKGLKGELCLIPANLEIQPLSPISGDVFRMAIEHLLQEIERNQPRRFEACLLDLQSGYSEVMAVALTIIDFLFIFSCLTPQHILGTVVYTEFLRDVVSRHGVEVRYAMVTSRVPARETSRHEHLYANYRTLLESNTQMEILSEIPDDPSLHWEKELSVMRSGETGSAALVFRKIADYIETDILATK